MRLDEILKKAGKYKSRKRIGRGTGSGMGKTSGRGHKGAGARSGAGKRFGYEGGQNPAIARLPKRGFSNAPFRNDYQIVNVASLERFEDGSRVDKAALVAARLVDDGRTPLKILGNGELGRKLTVVADKFSASAAEKIEKAGGTVEWVGGAPKKVWKRRPPKADDAEVENVDGPADEAEVKDEQAGGDAAPANDADEQA